MRARPAWAIGLLAMCAAASGAQAPTRSVAAAREARIVRSLDSIAAATMAARPLAGLTLAVAHGARVSIVRRYGLGDVALQLPTPDRAVYQIGSVTKQMTAVAILQLVERGRLSLDASVSTLLPDLALRGPSVSVRQLLDHTSGLASYTEMSEFGGMMPQALPRDSLVRLIATKPRAFAPGEAMHYNNSAYFLLGLIIERVSGVSYDTYLRRSLFEPAAMRDAHYCSNRAIMPRTIRGYDVVGDTLRHAQYLDQRWPFAGGSVCATAHDLLSWNAALHGGRLLSAAMYRSLTTPGHLVDGTVLRYAGGLVVGDSLLGHAALHHDGAIPGFASSLAYLPDDSLSVVVLLNTLGAVTPIDVTTAVVRAVVGERMRRGASVAGDLRALVGEYRGRDRTGGSRVLRVTVAADGSARVHFDGGRPVAPDWMRPDMVALGHVRLAVRRDGDRVTEVQVDDGYSSARYTRIVPAAGPAATGALPADESARRYGGRYDLRDTVGGPVLPLRVFMEGGALVGQLRTNTPSRLEPLGDDRFRPVESPEFTVRFEVADGRATALTMEAPGMRWTGRREEAPASGSVSSASAGPEGTALDATLARLDSLLFDAAFVSCDTTKVFALLTRDIEFYHDQTGARTGQGVRDDFARLAASCPRAQGVRRVLVPESLKHFPIRDFGAMQTGEHRFEPADGRPAVGARFVHLWTNRDGTWKVSRIYSVDHAPAG